MQYDNWMLGAQLQYKSPCTTFWASDCYIPRAHWTSTNCWVMLWLHAHWRRLFVSRKATISFHLKLGCMIQNWYMRWFPLLNWVLIGEFKVLQKLFIKCLTSRREWNFIYIKHWWSIYNVCIWIQQHPCCVFELKLLIHQIVQLIQIKHLKNKLILDKFILNIII